MHPKGWNISSRPPASKAEVFVAFPGMGKTTYALQHAGVVDLDFGSFRSAFGVHPKQQGSLFPAFVKFINTFSKSGFTVLTNEPGLIPLLKSSGYQVVVSLPANKQALVQRVLKRASNPAFDKQLSIHVDEWVSDWARTAKKYGAEIRYQQYFDVNTSKEEPRNESSQNDA
nr:hypothetical protein [Picobirnavirus sp.]